MEQKKDNLKENKKEQEKENLNEIKQEEKPKKEIKEENAKETKPEEKPKKEIKEENAKETKPEEKVKKEIKTEKAKEVKKEEPKIQKQETKKFEVKNNNAKKMNNKKATWLVTLLPILAVAIVAVLLTIMIITSSDPKKSVDSFLTYVKAGDFEKAKEFITENEIFKDQELDEETQKLLFDKINWKVKKVTVENNNATVELEVTNKDFQIIISNCMKKALENLKTAILGGSLEAQDMEKYFIEELKNEQVQTKTQTKNIKLIKDKDKWKIESNDELVEALLPELQQAVNALN